MVCYQRVAAIFIFSLPQEILKEMALNQSLRCHVANYQAPSITEYMQVKSEHKKLQQGIHTWKCKARIAQVTRSQEKLCNGL